MKTVMNIQRMKRNRKNKSHHIADYCHQSQPSIYVTMLSLRNKMIKNK